MNVFDPREPVNTWTHAFGLVLAVVGTIYLGLQSRGCGPARRVSLLIFGFSLIFCYTTSTLFHGVRVAADRFFVFDRLDRIGIFVLIAGTYTPLAWVLLRGWWRRITLGTVWTITAVASGLLATGGPLTPAWMTGLYLGMGWGVVVCYAQLARVVSHRALLPLVVGGLCYSAGAIFNVLHWPVIRAGVFGAHELFHLFVIAGSLAHYLLVLHVVLPFEHDPLRKQPGRSQLVTPLGEAPAPRGRNPGPEGLG